MNPSDALIKKLQLHSQLDAAEIAAVRRLSCQFRELTSGEDFIKQGDTPHASAVVVEGALVRYHTLRDGRRQYLSLHIQGDWPDAQGLFLDRMDHSVCAAGRASVCAIPHSELLLTFRDHPVLGFAVWRETLIDAAMFRETITNNSSRPGLARLAHFLCEVYFRAEAVGLVSAGSCALPLNQTQIGEMLGMTLVSVSRHLQSLRKSRAVDLARGKLIIHDWHKLTSFGEFDPTYLQLAARK
jgi:CRP-like cAMP-binding protein